MIKKILRVNAENRPEMSKILEHPYFKEDGKEGAEGNKEEKLSLKKENKDEIKKEIRDEIRKEIRKENKEEGKKDISEVKKKEGDKKFEFFHRKGELKKEEPEKIEKKKEIYK